jgi:aldehyde:ferredoxin oxidoreductase
MHAGGQELPMHDGRYDAGFGIAYESEPTPGRHTIASYTYRDLMAMHKRTKRMPKGKLLHKFKERLGVEGKGVAQSLVSCFTDLINGCGLCLFGISIGGDAPVVEYINAATGWDRSFDDYLEMGRRIKTLRQAFNIREGIKPVEVKMNPRARGEPPIDYGPLKGIAPEFDALRREFYQAMGWDPETGHPTAKTLDELGLSELKS